MNHFSLEGMLFEAPVYVKEKGKDPYILFYLLERTNRLMILSSAEVAKPIAATKVGEWIRIEGKLCSRTGLDHRTGKNKYYTVLIAEVAKAIETKSFSMNDA